MNAVRDPVHDVVRVLFVCVENANRSQMAEAFARMHGGEAVDAASAGSRPSGRVSDKAVAAMAEVGYDLRGHRSKSLDEVAAGPWNAVVTMGCGDACPWVAADRRVDWPLADPRDLAADGVRAVRDDIERRVVSLLADLGVASIHRAASNR